MEHGVNADNKTTYLNSHESKHSLNTDLYRKHMHYRTTIKWPLFGQKEYIIQKKITKILITELIVQISVS
jgi:hypothetical protein